MASPLGSTPGIIVGVGVGAAASAALAPAVEPARQDAWAANANRVLEAGLYAELVAQGAIDLSAGRAGAIRSGFAHDKFDALAYLAQRAPSHAEAVEMRRRGEISPEQLTHAYAKEQIEEQYWDALTNLLDDRLSPQVAALAIVRGLMKDPGFLPVGPPTDVGNVPAFPVSALDALKESEASGFNSERLAVLVGIMGRPIGPESAAAAYFRDILKLADYQRAIAEGDVRNEWAEAILETARAIPSVSDYINARLRGWIEEPAMNAGVARHGMSSDDAHLIYLRSGRPAAPGQMATAVARKVDGPDGVPMNHAQFVKGIRESDIRPEWAEMLWGIRYAYPPLFQIGRLVQAGAITTETALDWLEKDRYAPEVLAALKTYYDGLGGGGTKADPYIAKAETQLWTAIHRSVIDAGIDKDAADNALAAIVPDAGVRAQILELWAQEKTVTAKQLTPSQIKKAYKANEFTQDEAVTRLELLNMDDADALTYLTS